MLSLDLSSYDSKKNVASQLYIHKKGLHDLVDIGMVWMRLFSFFVVVVDVTRCYTLLYVYVAITLYL